MRRIDWLSQNHLNGIPDSITAMVQLVYCVFHTEDHIVTMELALVAYQVEDYYLFFQTSLVTKTTQRGPLLLSPALRSVLGC